MSRKNVAKVVVSSAVLACIAFFFYRAFKANWATIQAQGVDLHYGYLFAGILCIAATYFAPTWGWQLTVNGLSRGHQLSFSQSFAAVNASSLTKYIPGKIWSYALQMYWLAAAGFPKSLIVYVNMINLFISLISSLLVGVLLLLPSADRFPIGLTGGALAALVAVDLMALKFHDALFKWLIATYNRWAKRDLQYYRISTKLVVQLHLLHVFAAFAFGLAAYFACLGIGYPVGVERAPLFMAALLLSDTIAFAALIVPGGLGVREGIMYAMLGGAASGPVALLLPVATRISHMIVDVVLGATALRLLRSLNGRQVISTVGDVNKNAGEQPDAK
jgi:glycosyltransferase 2 family protein